MYEDTISSIQIPLEFISSRVIANQFSLANCSTFFANNSLAFSGLSRSSNLSVSRSAYHSLTEEFTLL
jgi:hypothetical protein